MSLLTQIETDIASVFLNTDDFAQSAVWTPDGGEATSIDVIFDDEYSGVNMATGELDTSDPMVKAQTSVVSGITQGDEIVVNSTTYYVKSVQPDGTGISIIQLTKRALNNG